MASQPQQNPSENRPEPTVITLDHQNSVQILSQYIELAQSKGAYLLAEAELLKRASDFLINKVPDAELNDTNTRQLLIQGIHKGQRHGAYTLNDAALLHKVVQFVSGAFAPAPPAANSDVSPPVDTAQSSDDSNDLSDLAEPIPLKPKEV
ncbi:MAG: hypothetical protein EBU90_04445 [Proteobacteria bacterium]|nr:hypothetical protein [Pseudomonadota bacterium]NBP15085.1 hypothetical protein [bacterium]